MFTRRPAVPRRRRTAPRRVNIEFVLHARVFIRYSTNETEETYETETNEKKTSALSWIIIQSRSYIFLTKIMQFLVQTDQYTENS